MGKVRTVLSCRECGQQLARWAGRCPGCGAWGTIEEGGARSPSSGPLETLAHEDADERRVSTGLPGIDRVLGGGLVPSTVALLAGARHQQGISLRQETASGAAVRRRQQATARPRESHPSRSGWFAESRKPSLRALGSVGSLPDVDQFDQGSVYSCSPGDPVHRRNKARWSAERAAATAPTASSATPLAAAASSWRSILSSASASPRDADHTEGA
jgi:hypothetical protein